MKRVQAKTLLKLLPGSLGLRICDPLDKLVRVNTVRRDGNRILIKIEGEARERDLWEKTLLRISDG